MKRRSAREAEREYVSTHWGIEGPRGVFKLPAPDPTFGAATALGHLVSVTYRTTKLGDGDDLTDYEHKFAVRGGRPVLAFNDTGLLILGGGYTVNYRGIVG